LIGKASFSQRIFAEVRLTCDDGSNTTNTRTKQRAGGLRIINYYTSKKLIEEQADELETFLLEMGTETQLTPWRKLLACGVLENGKLEAYPTLAFGGSNQWLRT
jgi:hypothetical protein